MIGSIHSWDRYQEDPELGDPYAAMTNEDFDTILVTLCEQMGVRQLLAIPGIWDILVEELKNEVLDYWEAQQRETKR